VLVVLVELIFGIVEDGIGSSAEEGACHHGG